MKRFVITAVFVAMYGATLSVSPSEAAPPLPAFQPESIADFGAALERVRHRTLDAQHRNSVAYHAYKFIDPQMVIVGVARAVTVDPSGRLHIDQAPGQPMGGRPNYSHTEYSHILVPAGVVPPRP